MTYTEVRYFSAYDDDLKEMRNAYWRMRKDFDIRSPYMDDKAYDAGSKRLDILAAAIDLLEEPVPRSFGG